MENQFCFTQEAWDSNGVRLSKQILKILPMYENEEDWTKQRDTVVLELRGYNDLFSDCSRFIVMVGKLAALSHAEDHASFRKLVFEAMSEIKEVSEWASKK